MRGVFPGAPTIWAATPPWRVSKNSCVILWGLNVLRRVRRAGQPETGEGGKAIDLVLPDRAANGSVISALLGGGLDRKLSGRQDQPSARKR